MTKLPSLQELHVVVKMPEDWSTHVFNLETAYGTALEEIERLLQEPAIPTKFKVDHCEFTRGWNACVDTMLQRGPQGSEATATHADGASVTEQSDPHQSKSPPSPT
jgi:hypothetical protein